MDISASLTSIRDNLHRIERDLTQLRTHLDTRLNRNHERQDRMAVDTTKLLAAVETLKADQAKNAADIKAMIDKLSGVSSTDPAVQATIDQAVADLGTIAAGMEASNAAAETA